MAVTEQGIEPLSPKCLMPVHEPGPGEQSRCKGHKAVGAEKQGGKMKKKYRSANMLACPEH